MERGARGYDPPLAHHTTWLGLTLTSGAVAFYVCHLIRQTVGCAIIRPCPLIDRFVLLVTDIVNSLPNLATPLQPSNNGVDRRQDILVFTGWEPQLFQRTPHLRRHQAPVSRCPERSPASVRQTTKVHL